MHKITYNVNGGNGEIEPTVLKQYANSYITAIIPKRANYDFLGWASSKTAETAEYLPKDIYNGHKDITLYAVWALIPYIECNLTKCSDSYICTTDLYNMPKDCEMLFFAHKDREIVSFGTRSYSTNREEFTTFADFDSITVFVLNRQNKLAPILAINKVYKD